jgi:hypothetical protein
MGYDAGLVQRVADALGQIPAPGVRQKNVFGGRGFLLGSRTFAIVWDDDLLVRLRPDEVRIALGEPGIKPFEPDGESASRTWIVVTAERIAEDPELVVWLRRSLGLYG